MGGAGLSVDAGDPVAEHGAAGRYRRQTQDLCHRVRRLHCGVGAVRVCARRRLARGRARHPGGGRGDDPGAGPGHRHRNFPAHRARPRTGHHRLDGIYGHHPGADHWRAADREFRLALDLLPQLAYRHRGHIPCLAFRPCHPTGGRPEVRLRRRLVPFRGDVRAADGHVAGATLGLHGPACWRCWGCRS